jgi:hypothetical protein
MATAFGAGPISDWTWKQAVAERVLQIVNERATDSFTIDKIYAFVPELSDLFPRNRHVREKIRQSLQNLRDDAFLFFEGEGVPFCPAVGDGSLQSSKQL